MVGALGPDANAGAIVQPEPPLFLLLLRDFQPFTAPNPFNALVVHIPDRTVRGLRGAGGRGTAGGAKPGKSRRAASGAEQCVALVEEYLDDWY